MATFVDVLTLQNCTIQDLPLLRGLRQAMKAFLSFIKNNRQSLVGYILLHVMRNSDMEASS